MSTITVNPVIYAVTVSGINGGVGATSLDQLTDVSVTAATTGYTLIHDGTQFVSQLGTGTFAAAAHTHAQSDITGLTAALAQDGTDIAALQASVAAIGTIGTAGYLNVPASGDAGVGQVVKGNDTRLTDARTAVAHVIECGEGDTLIVPSLWFHYAISLTQSAASTAVTQPLRK